MWCRQNETAILTIQHIIPQHIWPLFTIKCSDSTSGYARSARRRTWETISAENSIFCLLLVFPKIWGKTVVICGFPPISQCIIKTKTETFEVQRQSQKHLLIISYYWWLHQLYSYISCHWKKTIIGFLRSVDRAEKKQKKIYQSIHIYINKHPL